MSSFFPVNTGDIVQSGSIDHLADASAWYSADASTTAGTYAVTFAGAAPNFYAMSELKQGHLINFLANSTNQASVTPSLVVTGNGSTSWNFPITRPGGAALQSGDIQANQMVSVLFNALQNRFELIGGNLANGYLPLSGGTMTGPLVPYNPGTGIGGLAIGSGAGANSAAANYCTYAGTNAGQANHSAQCTFFGCYAGLASQGVGSTGVGYNALAGAGGSANTAFGANAGSACTGSYTCMIGGSSGFSVSGTYDVFVGVNAGASVGNGNYDTYVGANSGVNSALYPP